MEMAIKGLPNFAPYDKIIVTCGAPVLPKILIEQLKIGGLMVAPIGNGEIQTMHLIEKIDDNKVSISKHGDFSFVPMLNNKQKNKIILLANLSGFRIYFVRSEIIISHPCFISSSEIVNGGDILIAVFVNKK